MPSSPPPDRAALARERLAAKRLHVANLRRRVIVGALATFVLAWGVIAFNGSMGTGTTSATTASAGTTAGTTEADDDSTWWADDDSSDHDEDDDTVTTAQS